MRGLFTSFRTATRWGQHRTIEGKTYALLERLPTKREAMDAANEYRKDARGYKPGTWSIRIMRLPVDDVPGKRWGVYARQTAKR